MAQRPVPGVSCLHGHTGRFRCSGDGVCLLLHALSGVRCAVGVSPRFNHTTPSFSSSSSSSSASAVEEWEVSENEQEWAPAEQGEQPDDQHADALRDRRLPRQAAEQREVPAGHRRAHALQRERWVGPRRSLHGRTTLHVRPSHTQYSAVFSSLLSMGFGEPLVALAIEAEGEDIQRCLAFSCPCSSPPLAPSPSPRRCPPFPLMARWSPWQGL